MRNLFIMRTLKGSLGTVYDSVKPLKFFPGALRHLYYAVTHEFQRPNAVVIHSRISRFGNKATFKINGSSDPRDTIKSIEKEASILNNLHESVNITDTQKLIALRNAAFDNSVYTQAIKNLEGESKATKTMPKFSDFARVITDEYINYVKEQPKEGTESANVASATSRHQDYDQKSEMVFPEHLYDDEHANWVDVPKGVCIQYAIKGKCDRKNCDYKHVHIEPNQNSENRNNHSSHNSRGSRDRRTNFSSRFSPKAPSFKHKNVHQQRARKQELVANFVSALAGTLEESQSDSDNTATEDSNDSDSDENSKTSAFLSALQAAMTKTKNYKKKPHKPSSPKFSKDHPNRKKYLQKIAELVKREGKEKSKKKDKTTSKKDNLSANLATLLLNRKVRIALGDTSDSESGNSSE